MISKYSYEDNDAICDFAYLNASKMYELYLDITYAKNATQNVFF